MPLAFRLARREMRGGIKGFRIFLACLALGVAVIAGVGSLAASIGAGLALDAQAMLGGDVEANLVLRPADERELAYLLGSGQVSEVMGMRAMARSDDESGRSLIELKAVDANYPLYGAVTLDPPQPLQQALARRDGRWGAVAAPALMQRLGLKPGDVIRVGSARFELSAALTHEPDAATGIFILGPRLMVSSEALSETGLVMPGTLISYAYRVRLQPGTNPEAWSAGLHAAFPESGWRLRNFANAAPTLRRLLDRVGLFLTLVGLTALLVGGVGVGNAVASYLANRTLSIAILKSVGASGRLIFRTYLTQIAVLAALGIGIGLAIGAIVPLLAGHFLTTAWPLPMRLGLYPLPLAIAAAAGALTTVAFALGPLARARAVPPATLFRAAVEPPPTPRRASLLLAQCVSGLLLAGLAIASSSDRRLAVWAVLSALSALAVFRMAGVLVVALVRRVPRARRPALRIALTNLGRRGANTASVIASLGLGLTVLVALSLVQGNISLTLDRELPERAPSFFFIDIQPDETAAFDQLVEGFPDATGFEQAPSLRGHIVRLNGVAVEQAKVAGDAQWALRSERGLTYAATLPAGSHLAEGQWWPSDYRGPPLVSFDADLARGMGLRIGDTLTVNVLGRDVTATIANLRAIDWTSLGINFAMVFSPGTFAGAPETGIAMVRLPSEREAALQKAVTDRFPNISSIPVKDALKSVSDIVSAVAVALQATAAVALAAATLVLAGALAAARRRRLYESVVLKVLGATRLDLVKSFLWEYGLLGLLAATIAGVLGTVAAYLVLTQVMRAEWVFLPETALVSAGVGLLLTLGLGYAGTWRALGTSAAPYLRNE